MFFLSAILSSCASTPPADLEKLVRVFNVSRSGAEALPRQVEGCEALGSVYASAPAPELNSTVITSQSGLLETIRARAHRKGADTAFVSLESGAGNQQVLGVDQGGSLRATIFRCGDSTTPETLGTPVR